MGSESCKKHGGYLKKFFLSEISGVRLLIVTVIIGKLSQNHRITLDLIMYI